MDCFEMITLFILSLDYSFKNSGWLAIWAVFISWTCAFGYWLRALLFHTLMCILNRSAIQLFVDTALGFPRKQSLLRTCSLFNPLRGPGRLVWNLRITWRGRKGKWSREGGKQTLYMFCIARWNSLINIHSCLLGAETCSQLSIENHHTIGKS